VLKIPLLTALPQKVQTLKYEKLRSGLDLFCVLPWGFLISQHDCFLKVW
jgi:hypothetical protein